MEVVILTGMSGAGKSFSAKCLEDMGYFCVDNLPPHMVPEMIKAFEAGGQTGQAIERLAFVVDIRSADMFRGLIPSLQRVFDTGIPCTVIFLEADSTELIARYKQTRRNHPLARDISLSAAIEEERRRLLPLKSFATEVIDTTRLSPSDLRDTLHRILDKEGDKGEMSILIQSFGYKYGLPPDSDIVLDVRFLPNPFYRRDLRMFSGLDAEVSQYVQSFPETIRYMDLQEELLAYTIPFYRREGKQRLVVAIGCTGGRHRSVVLAADLAARLRNRGMPVILLHRDIDKDPRASREDNAYRPDQPDEPEAESLNP
ncbi:MAG: RNase adapter RapZ [Clostridia bacterium]|nr:RNase adapter RapZ [Clostridia bacterium]